MRDYGKVSPKFWIGNTGKKIRALGMEAQIVAMYLLTCGSSNMLGLYYLPIIYISHETALDLEGASEGLNRCIEAGFCSYDEASEVVFVHEMAIYQIAEQLKPNDNRVKGIQKEYDGLPNCLFLYDFYLKYKDKFLLENPRGEANKNTQTEAPSKPLASQEQEQEQDQEQEQENTQGGSEVNSTVGEITPAASVCIAIKRVYAQFKKPPHDINQTLPKFVACMEAGATEQEFLDVANEALRKGKGFAYICGTVFNRRKEISELPKIHEGGMPNQNSLSAANRGIFGDSRGDEKLIEGQVINAN